MICLLARRRGGGRAIGAAIGYLWRGCQSGDPTAIGITSVIGVVVVGFVGLKIKGMMDGE